MIAMCDHKLFISIFRIPGVFLYDSVCFSLCFRVARKIIWEDQILYGEDEPEKVCLPMRSRDLEPKAVNIT